MVQEYRQIPIIVKAMQFTGDNKVECIEFTEKRATAFSGAGISKKISKANHNWFLIIPTPYGNKQADAGDYIVKTPNGDRFEYLHCAEDVFKQCYELLPKTMAEVVPNTADLLMQGYQPANKPSEDVVPVAKPDIKSILENALSYNHCDGVVAEGGRLEGAIITAINECLDQYKETLINLK